jgi:hypothetical protein
MSWAAGNGAGVREAGTAACRHRRPGGATVRRLIPIETDVDEVRNSLLGGTDVGRRVDPALRELERKRYHWFVAGFWSER